MVRRLAQAILGLALLVYPAAAVVPSVHAASGGWKIDSASRFSPNGDGAKDTLYVGGRNRAAAQGVRPLRPARFSHGSVARELVFASGARRDAAGRRDPLRRCAEKALAAVEE